LGSFSKILAPGLRLGYLVAPEPLYPKLLQAKQAADLHSPSFNQRIVFEVIRNGMLSSHVPRIRALYKAQRDAMLAALSREMSELDVHWTCPQGGMFIWLQRPLAVDAAALLPLAVQAGMAFVPGSAFYADTPQHHTLRLSFVTADRPAIDQAIQILARLLKAQV
jgi:2-aminoadipate transaminase